ncbi:MAG: outer membrane protein assembly factor BamB family protein [Microthrixaceae bacterium]
MPDDRRRSLTLLGLATITVLAVVLSLRLDAEDGRGQDARGGARGGAHASRDTTTTTLPRGEFFRTRYAGFADPKGFLKPYPNAAIEGLLTFRGNPSRSYYGKGPVPRTAPQVLHRFPDEPMCRSSANLGETKVWCGMGWTGQPLIAERKDRRWAIFGGYDGHIHFMDAISGERILPDVATGDLIKGTPTLDPEGYPLVYTGSRDNLLRVIAFDRVGQAEVLWTLDSESVPPNLWNDDWDSSPIVLGDYLVEGSESSRFWVIKLNRAYDKATGLVRVDPKVVFTTPVWDQAVLAANGDEHASVESSIAVYKDTAYFGTSAGLIWGYDLSPLRTGGAPKPVFRFYTAGDNDPTPVVDEDGMLYVAGEFDRDLPRAREVGQLTKVDPSNAVNPIVWTFTETTNVNAGIYGTPAIVGNTVIVTTDGGRLIALDRATGAVKWERRLPGPLWGSPVVVDDVLLVGDCSGFFHALDVSNPDVSPPELWSVELGGCIEATPAVWDGRIYIGTRSGYLFVLGEAPASSATTTTGSRGSTSSTSTTRPTSYGE